MRDSSSPSRATSEPPADGAVDRRAFLAAAGCAALCAAAGCTVPPRSFRVRQRSDAIRVPVASYPELERPGGVVKVLVGPEEVYFLRRAESGEAFDAISGICTHQGCTVTPAGDGFQCPCHASSFDRDGLNVSGPARRPLARFAAARDGADVVIRLRG